MGQQTKYRRLSLDNIIAIFKQIVSSSVWAIDLKSIGSSSRHKGTTDIYYKFNSIQNLWVCLWWIIIIGLTEVWRPYLRMGSVVLWAWVSRMPKNEVQPLPSWLLHDYRYNVICYLGFFTIMTEPSSMSQNKSFFKGFLLVYFIRVTRHVISNMWYSFSFAYRKL